ncbi:MAG: biotin transporter BioY [Brevundimonas sp.]|uniref:biotin transporter BioY n=1 Tax=Brevundimonas sp. TaxID=1871086 RepID=UPI00391CFA8B
MSHNPAPDPLGVQRAGRLRQLAWVVGGVIVLAVSSRIAIPMVPVPITLQTLAVTLIGALYGWRLGGLTVGVWLVAAAAGLHLLSDGASGLAPFAGATAGYLFAFPLAAALVGVLTARGWNGRRPGLLLAAMLMGNGLCLALGAAWLAARIGAAPALEAGVLPFLPGAVVKSAVGAGVVVALHRMTMRRD